MLCAGEVRAAPIKWRNHRSSQLQCENAYVLSMSRRRVNSLKMLGSRRPDVKTLLGRWRRPT